MDIYSFMNSRDIAEYLKKIEYKFSAYEMAYLVYQSKYTTLAEKLDAWNRIVETTIDQDIPYRWIEEEHSAASSVHDLIKKYTYFMKRCIDSFPESDGYWFSIDYMRKGRDRYIDMVFDSFESCIEYLRKDIHEEDDYLKEKLAEGKELGWWEKPKERFIISKWRIGGDRFAEMDLNRGLEPLELTMHHYENDNDSCIELLFDNGHIRLPIPFNYGDIVIDATNAEAKPFVFQSLKFWDTKTLKEHGSKIEISKEQAKKLDERVKRYNKQFIWDPSHMVVMGDELATSHWGEATLGMTWIDDFGAANYLDIEYCREPLIGEERLIKVISEFQKGEIDTECLLNLATYITVDSRAKRLRDFIQTQYDEYIRALLKDEYPVQEPSCD